MIDSIKDRIYKLKRLVNEIESYAQIGHENEILERAEEVITTAQSLQMAMKEQNEEEVHEKEIVDFHYMSNLPFLYKPVMRKNYYDGDYLEQFSTQRTDDLKRAEAFDKHNKFWSVNLIEKGNIFGSIPKELLDEEAQRRLMSYGWDTAEVYVYKTENLSLREVGERCEKNMEHYLVVTETKHHKIYVLQFKP